MLMPWDAILFDLDGTLWNAIHVTALTWIEVMKNHPEIDRTVDAETVEGLMGYTNEELAARLFPELPFEVAFGLMMESCAMENVILRREGGHLYPNVPQVLETIAKKYPIGVISNCQSGYVEAFLDYHGFASLCCDHTCSGDTGKRKAENIRMVCQRNGFTNALYVGDTIHDAEAAKEAGCGFVWATYGFGLPDTVPEDIYIAKIAQPTDLLRFLKL